MKILRELASYLVGVILATLVMLGCTSATSHIIFSGLAFEPGTGFYTLIAGLIAISLLLGWWLARSHLGLSGPPFSRHVRVVLLALYFATWIAGVPAVLSKLTAEEVSAYKQMRAEHNRVWEAHPFIAFDASFPVAPFLLLTHHRYQVAGLYGWGGWEVHLWYVLGCRSVFQDSEWVS